jgi:uncharacterized membrane protein
MAEWGISLRYPLIFWSFPVKPYMEMRRNWGTFVLDALIAALVGLWLMGGIEWQGRLILKHGADPRRAALIVGALGAWLWPAFRARSFWVRFALRFWSWLETRRGRWIALGGGCLLACVIGVLQTLALRVPLYDVGLFHQILWSLAHGHGFVSTISGAGNFLLDHLSPSLSLLVPAYRLSGSSPLVLSVVLPLILYAGVSAGVWLAEQRADRESRKWLPAAAVVFGLTFESLWGNLSWGFHENAIAFAALSWAFALIAAGGADRGRKLAVLVLFVIAAGSKEILLVDVALALLAWAMMERKKDRFVAVFSVILAVAFLAAFVWFEKLPHPADKNYFDRYYAYLGHGLGDFFKTLLFSPWVVVQNVGARELARYFVAVFLPWLFLPLWMARGSSWLLVAILPSLASAALSTYPPLRGSSFHYVLELWPVLAVVTLLGFARMPTRASRRWAIAWAGLALLAWDHDPVGAMREYGRGAVEMAPVRRALAEIPVEDGVLGDELAGPWIAGRLQAARWPAVDALASGRCPRWVVLRSAAQLELTRKVCGGGEFASEHVVGEWRVGGVGGR